MAQGSGRALPGTGARRPCNPWRLQPIHRRQAGCEPTRWLAASQGTRRCRARDRQQTQGLDVLPPQ
ncbi:UNVERIFIED_CONTAM: hypothetical protein GTU68_024118 [Idotea baltica]|nr:hypothetical protein [Idotea baltica]